MKIVKLSFLGILLITGLILSAQVAINTDGTGIDNSAMLHLKSTDKGLLIPRMIQAEIEAIEGPADGLVVYNTDDSHFYIFDEADYKWKEIAIGAGTIFPGCGNVTDIDGNTYTTIIIGSQCWMAKNLATTKFNNGNPIPLIQDPNVWWSSIGAAYCWYFNNQANFGSTYGALYKWYTVGMANLCPVGWHVPTHGEWSVLTNYLGGSAVAGGKLKETGFIHWEVPNTGATNESGFTALPGGCRYNSALWGFITTEGYWWSATEAGSTGAFYRNLFNSSSIILTSSKSKNYGFSVRCLKN